jgi:hypothetical protein
VIEVLQLNLNAIIGYSIISLQALIRETVVFSNFVLLTIWKKLDGVTASSFIFVAVAVALVWGGFLEVPVMVHKRWDEPVGIRSDQIYFA